MGNDVMAELAGYRLTPERSRAAEGNGWIPQQTQSWGACFLRGLQPRVSTTVCLRRRTFSLLPRGTAFGTTTAVRDHLFGKRRFRSAMFGSAVGSLRSVLLLDGT